MSYSWQINKHLLLVCLKQLLKWKSEKSRHKTCSTGDWEKGWRERLRWAHGRGQATKQITDNKYRYVTLLAVADYHNNTDIETYILTIINMTSDCYHDSSAGNLMDRIMYLHKQEKERHAHQPRRPRASASGTYRWTLRAWRTQPPRYRCSAQEVRHLYWKQDRQRAPVASLQSQRDLCNLRRYCTLWAAGTSGCSQNASPSQERSSSTTCHHVCACRQHTGQHAVSRPGRSYWTKTAQSASCTNRKPSFRFLKMPPATM